MRWCPTRAGIAWVVDMGPVQYGWQQVKRAHNELRCVPPGLCRSALRRRDDQRFTLTLLKKICLSGREWNAIIAEENNQRIVQNPSTLKLSLDKPHTWSSRPHAVYCAAMSSLTASLSGRKGGTTTSFGL